MTAALDVAFARSHFPGLDEWAFFENAGGTLVPSSVIERVRAYMTETQVQPGAPFPASAEAARRIEESQRLIAEMIGAAPEEVVIGPSTTMNVYVLAHALAPLFAPGDEIVVTDLDHEANSGAWRRLAERGLTIKEWRVDRATAELDLDALARLLGPRTRLVAVTQCSNIAGGINDIAAIARLVHEAGGWLCVDAVAYAPHRALDPRGLGADFYLFSLYKLYGPHLGVLWGRRELLRQARGQNHYFIGEDDLPLKLNPGGVNHELTASLSGIGAYFDALHAHHFPGSNADFRRRVGEVFDLIAAHEETMAARFLDFLAAKPGVRLIGRATAERTRRVPTFSFAVEGRQAEEVVRAVLPHKVAIRDGDFYAARLIDALGLRAQGGVVRASMVHYNTLEEVDRLIGALDAAI